MAVGMVIRRGNKPRLKRKGGWEGLCFRERRSASKEWEGWEGVR